MSYYLCKEGTEVFTMKADTDDQAHEYAAMYNAVVIRKCTEVEEKKIKEGKPI